MAGLEILGYAVETWCVWFVLGINVSCIATYLFVVAKTTLLLAPSWADVAKVLAAKWQSSIARDRQCWTARRSEDRLEAKVRHLAEQSRVERVTRFCRIAVHIFAGLAIISIVVFGYYDITIWHDAQRAQWELTDSSFVDLTLILTFCVYAWLFAGSVTPRQIDGMHCLFLLRLCWQAVACRDIYQLLSRREAITVSVRVLAALIMGRPTVSLTLNIMCSALTLWKITVLFVAASEEDQAFAQTQIIHEVSLCGMACSVSLLVTNWNYATVRANLKAKASSTNEATVKSLLVVLCDAMVVVDSDLVFTSASMEMAHFLLRRPLNNSYEGTSFLQFVPQDARQQVSESLTSSGLGHGRTVSLQTTLLDGHGAEIQVQLYCVCFLDIFDCRGFVIGLLEIRDAGCLQRQDALALENLHAVHQDALNGMRGSGALHSVSETDGFKAPARSEGETSVPLAVGSTELEIWIDIADDKLPVIEMSMTMTHIAGPQSDEPVSLFEWLRKKQAESMVSRISAAYDEICAAQPQEVSPTTALGKVTLRPPHALHAGLEYVIADMTADMARSLQFSESGKLLVCLRGNDIRIRNLTRKRSNRISVSRPTCGPLAENTSSASDSEGSDAGVGQPADEESFEVWLDVTDKRFVVQRSSTMVMTLAGLPSDEPVCFLDWLQKEKGTEFVNAVLAAVERFRSREDSASSVALGKIVLCPPQAATDGVEYIVDVTLDLTRSADMVEVDKVMVCLRSTHVRMKRSRAAPPSQLRHQSSPSACSANQGSNTSL
eukprot:TRINITY_DN11885_c0_g1_i10.p1 TRINITY_DN11885_c0_g1~~TRINITY_DN11885_c0_g1_i10.p1  ORF type:complete len:776 (+),score=92.86 TRINITY_DN11885_c0_g1_i10:175-2502(+)